MAKRPNQGIKNKQSRSRKTAKRLAVKYARKATKIGSKKGGRGGAKKRRA